MYHATVSAVIFTWFVDKGGCGIEFFSGLTEERGFFV
jgi:hypothetical protein